VTFCDPQNVIDAGDSPDEAEAAGAAEEEAPAAEEEGSGSGDAEE